MSVFESTQSILVDGVGNFREFQVDVREFITDFKARDDERKRVLETQQKAVKETLEAHTAQQNLELAQQNTRMNRVTVIVGVIGLIILVIGCIMAVLTYVEARKAAYKGLIKLPYIGSSQPLDASNQPQHATRW